MTLYPENLYELIFYSNYLIYPIQFSFNKDELDAICEKLNKLHSNHFAGKYVVKKVEEGNTIEFEKVNDSDWTSLTVPNFYAKQKRYDDERDFGRETQADKFGY